LAGIVIGSFFPTFRGHLKSLCPAAFRRICIRNDGRRVASNVQHICENGNHLFLNIFWAMTGDCCPAIATALLANGPETKPNALRHYLLKLILNLKASSGCESPCATFTL
jgi:hypothetical protein